MEGNFTTCSSCGRRLPLNQFRSRNEIQCACGMRIQPPRVLVDSRLSVVALMLLAALVVLLSAVAALAFRLAG